jgi:hypothetical protein
MPGISGSTPTGGGITLRCFGEGRLVLIFALGEETGHEFGKPDAPKQFMKCNIIALPDPQSPPFITFGGKADQTGRMTEPDTARIDVGPQGTLFSNVSIGGGGMLYILRRALKTNTGRVGRLFKDERYNGAWKLTDIAPGTPEMAAAEAWMTAHLSGTFTNPSPVQIPVIPQQQAAPQYAQPAQGWGAANQQQAPMAPPAQGWGPQPAAPVNTAPPAQGWGAPVQQNPAQPAQGWGQQAPQGWGQPPAAEPVGPNTAAPTGF